MMDCNVTAQVAEIIMAEHQAGTPAATLIEKGQGNALIRVLVIEAYKSPRYQTEMMRAKLIAEFRDQVYIACEVANEK